MIKPRSLFFLLVLVQGLACDCMDEDTFNQKYNHGVQDQSFATLYAKTKPSRERNNIELRVMALTGVNGNKNPTKVNVRTILVTSAQEDQIAELRMLKAAQLFQKHPKYFEEIYDCAEFLGNDGKRYIVLSELLEGYLSADLSDPVFAAFFMEEPKYRLEAIKKVGEALDILHQDGLVHSNVKPSNIMVNSANHFETVKLINPFFFKTTDEDVIDWEYIAWDLELEHTYRNQRFFVKHSPKQDMWALGLTIYFLENPGVNPFPKWDVRAIRTEQNFAGAALVMTDETWIKASGFYICDLDNNRTNCFINKMADLLEVRRGQRTITAAQFVQSLTNLMTRGKRMANPALRQLPSRMDKVFGAFRKYIPII